MFTYLPSWIVNMISYQIIIFSVLEAAESAGLPGQSGAHVLPGVGNGSGPGEPAVGREAGPGVVREPGAGLGGWEAAAHPEREGDEGESRGRAGAEVGHQGGSTESVKTSQDLVCTLRVSLNLEYYIPWCHFFYTIIIYICNVVLCEANINMLPELINLPFCWQTSCA